MRLDLLSYLNKQFRYHHLESTDAQQEKFITLIETLERWNRIYNLIGKSTSRDIVDRHIIDSLLVLPYIEGKRIIDVGTGAGFPGLPLAILLPNCHFTLLDSNGKKTRFITQIKVELGLNNVDVINARVEALQPTEKFDTIISRAFADLSDMLTATEHLATPEALFLALKGPSVDSELLSIPKDFVVNQTIKLPFADKRINRQLIILSKTPAFS